MSQGRRDLVAAIIAVGFGLAVAWMDSRPGYDATGITAGALVAVAAAASFVSGRRPLVWALAAGIWVPLFEARDASMPAPMAALAFAGVGAALGWFTARGQLQGAASRRDGRRADHVVLHKD